MKKIEIIVIVHCAVLERVSGSTWPMPATTSSTTTATGRVLQKKISSAAGSVLDPDPDPCGYVLKLLPVDPDPYWQYGSGSRTVKMESKKGEKFREQNCTYFFVLKIVYITLRARLF